jgi:hypothetical protein
MEQRHYKVSVDRYRINYTNAEGLQKAKRMWGTEEGIKEWIELNNLKDATYKITKKGVVQVGAPIPEWQP